ncbi:MAG: hypothetical protein U1F43_36365 [Myxococcota bacterium]
MNLAISLNASHDEQRTRLIPINKVWDLEKLGRCIFLPRTRGFAPARAVMLAGAGETPRTTPLARGQALQGIRCKVNLIPFNPWPGSKYQRPTPTAVDTFGQACSTAATP